ncbi:acetyl-CoA synthetase-like protein [Xylariaceae sp. AK1471]|nr:acetyl-CoA synthetase-like protein [Xylariaceae sp. AK1471]
MTASTQIADWESSLLYEDVVRSSKTALSIHIGVLGSPISTSTTTSSPASSGATTPELSQNDQSLFEIAIPSLGVGIAAKSKTCAAWAVLLASHGHVADISMIVRRPGEPGDDMDICVEWNLKVHDLIGQVETKLAEIFSETLRTSTPTGTAASGLYGESDYDETFHVVMPTTQTQSQELHFLCQMRSGCIYIKSNCQHDSSGTTCAHITTQYEYIIRQMCSSEGGEKILIDLKAIPIHDLNQVWVWNAQVPQAVEGICIHRSFMDRAARHPDLPAIAAHDGQLTYRELNELSTRLAQTLMQRGIKPKSTIIIFIEKSMWVPVAQLAVMKCGCASAMFDVSLPFQRHEALARLVEAAGILTSPDSEKQAGALRLGCVYLTLSVAASHCWPSSQFATLPEVRDSDTLYICFTSGSTGTPKGAIISHANYANAVALQQKRLDFREFDRVFDFASYAFDAAWCNLIHALMVGGCLCIPADEERKGDLPGALRKYKVNYAVLTPSVAWFPASELPDSLRTIHFGGEPLKASMVKEFSTCATIINAYGPAECSTVSTAAVTDPKDDNDPTIGTGLGVCTWVVRSDGSDLVAIGEIGELWLEGPIVGQGYLHEPEKTAASFVGSPPWLLRGSPSFLGSGGHPGRRGRLYRSGDLVRYEADGSLHFIGRKDSQVKIRGQRVELGEIEYNLQQALTNEARMKNIQIVAEVVTPEGSSASTLVSFLFLANNRAPQSDAIRATLHQALVGIEDRLALLVPPYMIPSAFIPIEEVPMTVTGKIDRRQLRDMGSKLYWHIFRSNSESETSEVETDLQTTIRKVWAEVLNLPITKITLDAIFTRLGGDSISAMQVVSRCRVKHISLSVADILKHQTIRKIAQSTPLKKPKEKLRDVRADEDKPFPLTPIQQVFFDNNPEGVNHYTLSYIVKLVKHTTIDELSAALLVITERHSMLRARFRKHTEVLGWEQFVALPGPESFHLEHHVFQDRAAMQLVVDERQASMDLFNGPIFAVDLFESVGEAQTLLMSAHHIIMDLVSWRILWHELSQYLSCKVQFPPLEISFQTWSHLQREEGEKLQPQEVLPFQIPPANFKYWDVTPEQLYFRDSILSITKVDIEATSLLLGESNDCFRTEIQDILLGTLISCFSQIFSDRHPPTVFLEGHGRESINGMDDLDLSEVIGWFTSLHPVTIGSRPGSSVLELIKFAKDIRKRMPLKGRPYFAARFYSEAGRKAFETHKHAEVIFNYRGSFQQLEDANSMLQLEDRPDRNLMIPGDGPDYRRPSPIDINLVIQEGSLQVWTRSHRYMRNHDGIIRWANLYSETLGRVAHELAGLPACYTPTDFPLLDISYDGLETLITKQINQMGIAESFVQDIYPCTPMQEGILISSSLDRATYHTVSIWEAVVDGRLVSTQRLQKAWDIVSRLHAVFSTIFSTNPDTGRFVQIVLCQPNEAAFFQAPDSQSAVEYLQQMPQSKMSQSRPECFFTVCSGNRGDVACRLEMTHALMDALSLPVIVRDIERAYMGQELFLKSHFRDYIAEMQRTPQLDRLSYWKNYLSGVVACNLPGNMTLGHPLPRPNSQYGWVTISADFTDSVSEICRGNEITRSVFLHAAWSLVLAHFTGMRQVCFGYISSGRDLPVDGIEDMIGPLINMQIALVDLEKPLASLLADVSQYHIEHLDHQHVSLAEIQHEISSKQLFNTNITVREARESASVIGSGIRLVEISEEDPHEYDIVLSATLNRVHTEVSIQYRTDFITSANAREIGHALENAIKFLSSTVERKPFAAISCTNSPGLSLYDAYFHHTFRTDEISALEQWKALFNGMDSACYLPAVVSGPSISGVKASASYTITNLTWRDDYDVTSQIFASWALLVASYGNTRDVIIGARLRNENVGVRKSAPPTPMRLVVDLDRTVSAHLSSVQSAMENHSRLPFLPFHRLRAIDNNSALACDFSAVLSFDEYPEINIENQPDESGWEAARKLSVHFSVTESGAQITSKFDENSISSAHITRIFSQLETVLRQLSSPANFSSKLLKIDTISGQDFRLISGWNGTHYNEVPCLVHDLISRIVRSMPDSLAISSWDGVLTYRQLDELSTRLAHHLVLLGVGPEVIVPVYFEKSLWVAVSIVGIMKAGGAGVMIDCTQPVERISSIFSQVDARFALVSNTTAVTAGRCSGVQLIIMNEAFLNNLPHPEQGVSLPNQVQPSNLLYVSFTSGSTGQPKGAMITHTCFASSIEHQQAALGFKAGRRVYDFASYAFDAAWSNLLHSLASGSCLCIPSEGERQNDLSKSIRDSKASLLNMTPSVLRHLDPRALPDVEQVLMGGEAWAEADFLDWIDNTRLINSYGPGECTIKSCLIRAFRGMVPNTIGFGIGLNTWIVRTDGSDRLAPLGSVGELWLEGPQVGRGYIADEAKTAASFVTRPKWTQGIIKEPTWTQADGPPCRFYRTGDLVCYGAGGALVFQSRIDSQVKIRGQRTELGEVERSIQISLVAGDMKAQIVADVFKPLKSANPILVAFLLTDQDDTMQEKLLDVDQKLASMVPSYMIPTAYITVKDFPMTATGKIHRKSLRETYMAMTLEKITTLNALRASNHLPPSTATERLLQGLWAEVLGIDPKTIFADSSFLRIGGDSLGAMRLVGLARKRGLVFTVADIFRQPQLRSFAADIQTQESVAIPLVSSTIEPLSLLDPTQSSREEAKAQAASLCGIDGIYVEDVFPCTPLQSGLLAETVKHPGMYVLTESWVFKENIDRRRFRAAWQSVIQRNPILRTRIVNLPQHGLVQVVIHYDCYKSAVRMEAIEFGLGTPLMSYDISESSFTWSIHHALYDGWTSPLIFNSLAKIYREETSAVATPFQAFIKYLEDYPKAEADDYWKSQFSGFQAQNFPVLPTTSYRPRCDQRLTHDFEYSPLNDGFTAATKIRLAWAILLAAITNSVDASFGTTVSGRQADVPGIEDMMGPTIATVPLRVTVDRSSTVQALLETVQSQAVGMMRFEQTGLQHIRRLSEDCKMGCAFQSFLIVQPESKHEGEHFLFKSSCVQDEIDHGDPFRQYAICLTADLFPNRLGLHVYYDSAVVAPPQMRRLLDRFENIFKQVSLAANGSQLVSQLDTSSSADLKQIWSWNDTIFHKSEQTIHEIFGHIVAQQPAAPAVCSWDGDFTYGQLDQLSTEIAQELLRANYFRNSQCVVPLYFDKSKWTSVCQLAVMKAGVTSTLLDSELPQRRLEVIIGLVKPGIILTSAELEAKARELAPSTTRIIVIGDSRTREVAPGSSPSLPAVDPDTWLYINFTSGSTGVPKGAIVSHSNFASAIKYGAKGMKFDTHTRTYDFAPYAFDVSWQNVLFTLCTGGCLCIPSQYEIHNEPVEAALRRRANSMHMIPSVSKLLHGAKLKLVQFGGEKVSLGEINHWTQQKSQIILTYGPVECTPTTTVHAVDPENPRVVIGKGLGVRTWIVEPQFGNKLAAIGDIGELWLEGPSVGQGYLKSPEQTKASFVDDPEWLLKGCPGFPGHTGRSYRTGDLVRYEEDGSIEYIGRKDAQIKIRGQRVHLEEIEHHILNVIGQAEVSQVVADIIKLKGSVEPALIAFIKPSKQKVNSGTPEAFEYARKLAKTSRRGLVASVPSYMIPNGFIIVDAIPKTGSGKVDRNKLREAAVAMRKEDILQVDHVGKRAPGTLEETKLHSLIARVLSWDGEPFGMDNNFIQLGGDSISAMRLVSVARGEGMLLRVADILSKDCLLDLLVTAHASVAVVESREPSFSLLDANSLDDFINDTVMPQIDSGHGVLVNVLLVTDLQRIYLSDNLHTPRRSWFCSYIDFDERVDLHRLVQSCERLVELCDIYRTAFVRAGGSFFQAVFESWKPTVRVIDDFDEIENALDRTVETEIKSPVQLGAPLISFTLLQTQVSKARLVFGMSHAIYDGISRYHTLQLLADLYNGSIPRVPNFRSFILHAQSSKADSYTYWRRTLRGSQMTIVPSVTAATSPGGPPTLIQCSVSMPKQPYGITQASIFTLACTSALSRVTGTSDVVIGRVVSGRAAIPAHLQDVVGPCVNRVPIRVNFDSSQTKASRLCDLQKQFTESIAYETTGLLDIVNHCTDWPRDTTDFGCWIQYQNIDEVSFLDILGALGNLKIKEMWEVPVASDFLEIFAVPNEGKLTIKIIGGPGFARETLNELLDSVCAEITDT